LIGEGEREKLSLEEHAEIETKRGRRKEI